MAVKYIDQIEMKDQRVMIRVDYNVPYDKEMNITDDTRITATIPTLNYCLENGARVILISHLGRPKGQVKESLSLKPVAERLSEILNKQVTFISESLGDETVEITEKMNNGDIILFENIRFYPGEEKNDRALGELIAKHADIFINDAFAAAHRGHASNFAVTEFMQTVAAGFLLKNEIEYSQKTIQSAQRPFGAIIGGAKVSSKLDALTNIVSKVDFLIIGGGMAFTFLKATGYSIGNSLLEEELIDSAKEIMKKANEKNVSILLPVDIVGASEFDNDSPNSVYPVDSIPDNIIGLDIGPESIKLFSEEIKKAKTVIWNGPMGAFEMSNFANGTNKIAQILADSDCLSIVGGGDSVTAINKAGVADKITYISTGGGAFLEVLEGKILPGIAALDKY
ncbi:MAG TPA: phosphoglycerate kinase [Spirochaetota bacterium]|nr:phosphoglycerate kinase [Spirochaetota bacterium]HPF06321.1 phosphoglycerate kinase [Spirochaetota bacterium]HPJ40919.1 phosphoglycerate kinase [Spirochaetota bacterium]HPR37733.1 phosphoglycerate kinase [Spirochaetota bacterium]HRX47746.1 phosphoglycerate kinase [Spirochaetota bacterium]